MSRGHGSKKVEYLCFKWSDVFTFIPENIINQNDLKSLDVFKT